MSAASSPEHQSNAAGQGQDEEARTLGQVCGHCVGKVAFHSQRDTASWARWAMAGGNGA
jgi:hypothetical protein